MNISCTYLSLPWPYNVSGQWKQETLLPKVVLTPLISYRQFQHLKAKTFRVLHSQKISTKISLVTVIFT